MSIEKLSNIWPDWQVVEQLGEGSFGKVYKVLREEHGVTSTAAVKVISIPQNDAELASIRAEGMDETGTRSYFEGIVTDFVGEIKLLESMKGTANVVSVEDYKVLEKTDKIGWDIFIRMELLTPLNDYIAGRALTEAEVIKLGQDICSALELCAQRDIMHRDVKPENIFVSSFGDFKLGDFGIARKLEKSNDSLSRKGTPNYMAPEIDMSKEYDATVDIYSLGLVLYKLLNNNRLPFLDPNAQLIQYQDRKDALNRRFDGEPLPAPINASPHLAQVILVACAFRPAERFQSPTAFKNALGAVLGAAPAPIPPKPVPPPAPQKPADAASDMDKTMTGRRPPEARQPVAQEPDVPIASFGREKKKKSKAKGVLIALLVLIVLGGAAVGAYILNPGGIFDGVHDVVGGIIGDPAADVITALEEGNHAEALSLAEEADGDALQRRLEERLDTLEADFRAENVAFAAVTMELDTIGRMNVSGLSSALTATRSSINNLNASRTAFNTAETLFESGDYAAAITQYRLVIQDDPNFERALAGVNNATSEYRYRVLSDANEYASRHDYESTIRVLDNGLRVIENDSTLMEVRILNEQRFIAATISQADTLVAEGRHDDAIALINGALQTVPGDDQLTSRRDEATAARPVGLSTVVVVDSSAYSHSEDIFTDSFGNHHHESFQFTPRANGWRNRYEYSDSGNSSYAVYNLNGNFRTFTADIVAPSGLHSDVEFLIEITFEDNRTPITFVEGYTVRTGTRRIEVDVSDVTTMTITVRVRGGSSTLQHSIRLVNAELAR
ncbi:MAG: protein kinase [Oscillospiraceae bacterium]|nr:protein kinase [Oscillospiraceae bacterium]